MYIKKQELDEYIDAEDIEFDIPISKRKKKGFTLIELLAVIIILGILLVIAIPSVTKYISDSRKEAYVKVAKQVVNGARNLVNDGKLEMYNTSATYYIPSSCVRTENGIAKSPYGEFVKAYVVVTFNGKGYDYYWTSVDEVGEGVKNIVDIDVLDTNHIESDVSADEIINGSRIDGKEYALSLDENDCKSFIEINSVVANFYSVIEERFANEDSLLKKYNGPSRDSIDREPTSDIYYYSSGNYSEEPNNNVLFANFCWRFFRTTDFGGVKLIYNGSPNANNECVPGLKHSGITSRSSVNFNNFSGNLYMGTDYIYDSNSQTYKISGEIKSIKPNKYMSKEVADTYLGYYTCGKNDPDESCSTMYLFDSWMYNAIFYAYYYGTINNQIIARSSYNTNAKSLSSVGYMYNKGYSSTNKTIPTDSNYLYSNDVYYENGEYTLIDPIPISDASTSENNALISGHHYTCFSTESKCEKVNFIHYSAINSSYVYYIVLSNGEKIENAINNMLYADDVNTNDSILKKMVDKWFEENMLGYSYYIDEAIYCNDRTISDYAGWSKNGNVTKQTLTFNGMVSSDLRTFVCNKVTDSFSIRNPKAKLNYSVGALTKLEVDNNMLSLALKNSDGFYTITPQDFQINNAKMNWTTGASNNSFAGYVYVDFFTGVRPVVTLRASIGFTKGDGSPTNPYVVG